MYNLEVFGLNFFDHFCIYKFNDPTLLYTLQTINNVLQITNIMARAALWSQATDLKSGGQYLLVGVFEVVKGHSMQNWPKAP